MDMAAPSTSSICLRWSYTSFPGAIKNKSYSVSRHGFHRLLTIRCKHKKRTTQTAPIEEGLHLSVSDARKPTRQRSLKHQLHRNVLASYRSRFAGALEAELNQELQEVRERLKLWPKKKLESEGLTIFGLSVKQEGSLFRDKIFKLYSSSGDGLLPSHNQFSQGDVAVMSRSNPLDVEENPIECVVMERARRFIKVVVPVNRSGELSHHRQWRLDLYANCVAYERCLFAVNMFSSPSVQNQGPVFHLENLKSVAKTNFGLSFEDSFTFGEAASVIRELIMKCKSEQVQTKDSQPEKLCGVDEVKATKSPPSRVGGKKLGGVKGLIRSYLHSIAEQLNGSQKLAIETAAVQRVTLWQGPPGTGKTRTLTHLVCALCRSGNKVLACADSNVAVDNLVEGLLGLGLKVTRIGQPVKVKEGLRNSVLDAQVANHPLMKKVKESREASIDQYKRSREAKNRSKRLLGFKDSKTLWKRAEELEARALEDVLHRADVVACTCIGAGDPILSNYKFDSCVIDEATQATEPATLVPLLTSCADSIVLVGDPQQLPPTVISSEAIVEGLDISLYQHLENCGLKPCFLDTQYRMHPEIAALPSMLFYSGKLKSFTSHDNRPPPMGFPWPNVRKPIVFFDCVDGNEESASSSNSWYNMAEAEQVVKVLHLFGSCKDIENGWEGIGVISPYSAQVRLLHDLLFHGDHDKFAGLEVKTVDGFQGREKEVIIISTVRSNREGNLGFVSDPRRMNVALTRAKRGLVVVGSSKTLENDTNWATWLSDIRKQKLIGVVYSDGVPHS